MAEPATPNERLPWLTEVPRIGPPPPPKKRWEFPWGAVLIGLAFAFVAVAAYYLGIRKAVEGRQPETARTMPLEQPYEEPAPAAPQASTNRAIASEGTATTIAEEPATPALDVRERPRSRQARTRAVTPPRLRTRSAPSNAIRVPLPVIVQPVVRGRIIQLGAFPTPVQAELAWRQLVKTWPYLATKPKLVSPIDVRSTDGKATRMHRLQLATASQAQSVVICQQLEAKKQSCAVVY